MEVAFVLYFAQLYIRRRRTTGTEFRRNRDRL